MIEAPKSTVEKPLTAIDYCACLVHCATIDEVAIFSEQLPLAVRQDERYTRAVAGRLAEIHQARAEAYLP